MILLQASAVQAAPSNSGSPAMTATDQPSHLEETVAVEYRVDDAAHQIRVLFDPRDDADQRLIASGRIVPPLGARRYFVDRRGKIGQKPARHGERVILGIDRFIDGATAKLDLPAAEFLLGARLAQSLDDRGTGD